MAAVYHGQRLAGDFYEFRRVSSSRVLFALMDVAGRRADTREVLIAVQGVFAELAVQLFSQERVNEAEGMSALCHEINCTILQCSRGVRSCPAFISCYNEDLATLCYANAGHTPAVLIDGNGIRTLEATGLPLGLFSHTVHSSSTCALLPGAALLIVSRGLFETGGNGAEFGLEGVLRASEGVMPCAASKLCTTILQNARAFAADSLVHNDLTALALVRSNGVHSAAMPGPRGAMSTSCGP
jgi:serine phosphatase RsbU (regulator of sigma subunit)